MAVLGVDCDALDLGCGIGRFEQALAPHLRWITGIDLSSNMIAAARTRCAGIPNVTLAECSGRDLSMFEDDRFSLLLSVDAFPYLYQSGMTLVEAHFREARRVLRARGHLVILEFSYRGNLALDCADVDRLASAWGFNVRVRGSRPFSLWDGAAFRLVSTSSFAAQDGIGNRQSRAASDRATTQNEIDSDGSTVLRREAATARPRQWPMRPT